MKATTFAFDPTSSTLTLDDVEGLPVLGNTTTLGLRTLAQIRGAAWRGLKRAELVASIMATVPPTTGDEFAPIDPGFVSRARVTKSGRAWLTGCTTEIEPALELWGSHNPRCDVTVELTRNVLVGHLGQAVADAMSKRQVAEFARPAIVRGTKNPTSARLAA